MALGDRDFVGNNQVNAKSLSRSRCQQNGNRFASRGGLIPVTKSYQKVAYGIGVLFKVSNTYQVISTSLPISQTFPGFGAVILTEPANTALTMVARLRSVVLSIEGME